MQTHCPEDGGPGGYASGIFNTAPVRPSDGGLISRGSSPETSQQKMERTALSTALEAWNMIRRNDGDKATLVLPRGAAAKHTDDASWQEAIKSAIESGCTPMRAEDVRNPTDLTQLEHIAEYAAEDALLTESGSMDNGPATSAEADETAMELMRIVMDAA